ncbi:MAG TPA: hypothetical protein DCG69_06025 [Bacteroidales bacterium]|nr:hypothetical protein [Bacteroidales bacterium]
MIFKKRNSKSYSILLLSLLVVGFSNKLNAQEIPHNHLSEFSNEVYGTDDRLINGKYYKPKHFFALGHPYFKMNEWLPGTLFIKGIPYENIALKYSIEEDLIIIKDTYDKAMSKDIVLHNSFVDSLQIEKHLFHNTSNFANNNPIGYAELIYRGKTTAYFKHSIEFKDELSDRIKYGKYLKPRKNIYILKEDTFYLIKSKKEFLNLFSEKQDELISLIRKNKIRFKKMTDNQLRNLMQITENL